MTNQTLNSIEREFSDRNLGISFTVNQGLIRVHTDLTYTDQLSVVVSVNTNSQWNIGRSNRCAIVLHNATISRQHASLGYDRHSGFYIMDCCSHNGTFLNKVRLIPLKRYLLRDRDFLAFNGQSIQINISQQDLEPQT
jgi:pSer/pThr/pTyr-binding forkhead associated (FHA) protein